MSTQGSITASASAIFLDSAVDRLASQQTALQTQLSSGVVSNSYAGLGDQRYAALNLEPQLTRVAAWQTSITTAQSTLSVTQTAMSQINTIATNLQTSLTSLAGTTGGTTVAEAATEARSALTQLASLLNTQSGSRYVFGGTSADTPPVSDPSSIASGPFFNAIASSVASVGTTGAAATEAATVATAANNTSGQSVFSAALSVSASNAAAQGQTLEVGAQDNQAVGFVATAGSTPGTGSTGSSIRDLMRLLAVVGSLNQADATSAGFSTLVADSGSQLHTVASNLVATAASLGQTQNQLTTQASALDDMNDALTKQLGVAKDSDPTTLSAQITTTQNQLQASYSLIADMKGMSLAAYL